MKVLMAPVNIAGQPILAVRELRRQGVDATLLQYSYGESHPFRYASDKLFDLSGRHRLEAQAQALREALEEGYDIFHFWMGPLFLAGGFQGLYGFDLPFLKVRGRRIVYRGTGFDLRTRSLHCERNPYNPFRYGFQGLADEETHQEYLAYLRDYVDQFVVQDPEMHEFMPQAAVIPRGIELDRWEEAGIEKTKRPLVVHAPSKAEVKGTQFVLRAVEQLKEEGLEFDFELIEGMNHDEAQERYRAADIVVDQLLIGWYGVLTIEGLALGKPVLVYVRDDLYDKFSPEIPIHNANPDTVTDRLRELVTDYDLRLHLAERGRAFVEEVHDIRDVARRLKELYGEVLHSPLRVPETYADLDFLVGRYKEAEAPGKQAKVKARRYDSLLPTLKELRSKARLYDNVAGDLQDLRQKLIEARTALEGEREANARMSAQVEDSRQKLIAARQQLDAEREANHRRAGQIETLRAQIVEVRQLLEAEREGNARLAAHVQELRASLSAATERIAEHTDREEQPGDARGQLGIVAREDLG